MRNVAMCQLQICQQSIVAAHLKSGAKALYRNMERLHIESGAYECEN